MKKTLYIAVAAFSLLAVSCAKEIKGTGTGEGITAYANLAQIDEGTKSHGAYIYTIVWDKNDKITVIGGGNKDTFTLQSGEDTPDGTFKQDHDTSLGSELTAFSPASIVDENSKYIWPAEQTDIKTVSLVPMMATSYKASDGKVEFNFKPLGAVLQLVLTAKDGEINVKRIDITADQNLSGEFTVQDGAAVMPAKQGETPATSITTGDISSQNIKLTAEATYLNFAIPAGNFTNYKIAVTDTDGNPYSLSASSLPIQRATVNKLPVALNAGALFVDGGHKVTVALDEEAEGIETDVFSMAYKDGETVKIEAFSKTGKRLGCAFTGAASCDTTVTTDNIYTFTLSSISSNVSATVVYPRPTGVSLSKSVFDIEEGRSFKIKATVSPDDAYNKTITWSSDDNSVATVDENGRVTAKGAGEVVITATTKVGAVAATCTLTVNQYEPALSKEFSVGQNSKVRFSRGNLTYTPDIESWWFFNNQYDSGHNQDLLSLFTWGYGGWSTEWNTTSYQSGAFTDWGKQVGEGNLWRTLTKDEWGYLLGTRTDADEKVGYAKVCEKQGLLILPDEFVDPKTNESISSECEDKKFVPKSSTGWDMNVYTGGNWKAMESAGAVFLPDAGYRDGETFYSNLGCYWSATGLVTSQAHHMRFDSGNVFPGNSEFSGRGYSVRLVKVVE